MVLVSYSGKEINAKLVYYGPGLSGKTTNLEYIYGSIPSDNRGKMVSMKTKTERTLFFDFLPIQLGELSGFKTRFLLYTVPGQVYYNATRKLVLKGVDAVVFVADSKRGKMNENVESLENLRDNLREHGLNLDEIPWVLQYNKRDLPDTYSPKELDEVLNPHNVPAYEAVAMNGDGVIDTFKGVSRLLLRKLAKDIGVKVSKTARSQASPAGQPTPITPGTSTPRATPLATGPSQLGGSPGSTSPRPQATKITPIGPLPPSSDPKPVVETHSISGPLASPPSPPSDILTARAQTPGSPPPPRVTDVAEEAATAAATPPISPSPPRKASEFVNSRGRSIAEDSADVRPEPAMTDPAPPGVSNPDLSVGQRLRRWLKRDDEPQQSQEFTLGTNSMMEPPPATPVESGPGPDPNGFFPPKPTDRPPVPMGITGPEFQLGPEIQLGTQTESDSTVSPAADSGLSAETTPVGEVERDTASTGESEPKLKTTGSPREIVLPLQLQPEDVKNGIVLRLSISVPSESADRGKEAA